MYRVKDAGIYSGIDAFKSNSPLSGAPLSLVAKDFTSAALGLASQNDDV